MSDRGNGRRGGDTRRGGRVRSGDQRPGGRRPRREEQNEGPDDPWANAKSSARDEHPAPARRGRGGRPPSRAEGRSGGRPSPRRPPSDRPGSGRSSSGRPGSERPRSTNSRTIPDPDEGRAAERQTRAAERLAEVEELEVTVEKLVAGGDGLARFEGIPIFIARSAPGDRLRVQLSERKPGFGRADIVEILEPGPGRREAPCPHYDACGGCDLQHLDEKTQLRAKAAAVVETLRRLGGVEQLPKRFEIVAGEPWGYRLRTQLHVETTERGAQAGYFGRGSHELVPVERCPILRPQLEKILRRLPRFLRTGPVPARFDLAAGDDDSLTCSPPHERLPQGEVTITVGDFAYQYDARCFFQAHHSLTARLVEEAMGDEIVGTDADDVDSGAAVARGRKAFDLYAGVGLFSLPLSRRYEKVTAVDGDRVAIRFARRNARLNDRGHLVQTLAQAVESWIYELPEDADRVLVDPPRAGLSARVRGLISARRPKRLTYVSCQPATLARDLKYLLRTFHLDSLTLLDMFPQTGHMESVAQLRLKD